MAAPVILVSLVIVGFLVALWTLGSRASVALTRAQTAAAKREHDHRTRQSLIELERLDHQAFQRIDNVGQ